VRIVCRAPSRFLGYRPTPTKGTAMKKIAVRKAGTVRLTTVHTALYAICNA
jgi:hypothetical protein